MALINQKSAANKGSPISLSVSISTGIIKLKTAISVNKSPIISIILSITVTIIISKARTGELFGGKG